MLAATLASAHANAQWNPELLVKAGLITKFPQFVTWPADALDPTGRFVICVAKHSPMVQPLRRIAGFSRIKNMPTEIRPLENSASAGACHVLYIDGSNPGTLKTIITQVQDRPVLTVADTPGYAQKGVMINLQPKNQRVRFEVNRVAVNRSGLDMSFRLLEIAEIVDPASNVNNVADIRSGEEELVQ